MTYGTNGTPILDTGNLPVTFHVQLAPELVRMLEVFAAAANAKPETIIAESVRSYLGADQ